MMKMATRTRICLLQRWMLLILLLLLGTAVVSEEANEDAGHERDAEKNDNNNDDHNDDDILWKGPSDRFWWHHSETKTLIDTNSGIDYYPALRQCLDTHLTTDQQDAIATATQDSTRQIGLKLRDGFRHEKVVLVLIERALHPLHALGVQTLAKCVRQHLPHLYEARAFYQELGLDNDDGLGGNNPTHLAPLVGVFFPAIVRELYQTVQLAYDAAGWSAYRKDTNIFDDDEALPPPSETGFRASEHLTYQDFVEGLDDHTDGPETHYTVNFAFSGPQDYDGGFFYIKHGEGPLYMTDGHVPKEQAFVKPNKLDCIVFLGGPYPHGVTEITCGHREMWSSELWHFPDAPFGSTLWLNRQDTFEEYIRQCNDAAVLATAGDASSSSSSFGTEPCPVNMTALSERVAVERAAREAAEWEANNKDDDSGDEEEDETVDDDDGEGEGYITIPNMRAFGLQSDEDYDEVEDFASKQDEPDFWVVIDPPLQTLVPLVWRDTFDLVDHGKAWWFQWGSPADEDEEDENNNNNKQHDEYEWDTQWVHDWGLPETARSLFYEDPLLRVRDTPRQFSLDNQSQWTAHRRGPVLENDLITLVPSAETQSLLSKELHPSKGGASTLLEQISQQLLLLWTPTHMNNHSSSSGPLQLKMAVHDLQFWCLSQSTGSESLHDVMDPSQGPAGGTTKDSWRFLMRLDLNENAEGSKDENAKLLHIQIGQLDAEDDHFVDWGFLTWRPQMGVLLHHSTFFAPSDMDYRSRKGMEMFLAISLTPVGASTTESSSSLPENTLFTYGPWEIIDETKEERFNEASESWATLQDTTATCTNHASA